MGKVEAFTLPGCKCWFWAGDHGAPHFHVQKADEWEIRVFFHEEPARVVLKWAARHFPAAIARQVQLLAAEHREALWVEWSRKVVTDDE